MRKSLAILIIATFVISTFALLPVVTPAKAAPTSSPDYQRTDIANAPFYGYSVDESIEPRTHHSYWNVGDIAYWLILDDYYGVYRLARFQLRAIGTTAEIWVQVNLGWPVGDTRAYPTILDSQIQYLLNEFQGKIYPTDTSYFGVPATRDGSNALLPSMLGLPSDYYTESSGRNVILVSNIRDESYYVPSYPYYVAGFFTSAFDTYFDRNIISIDSLSWQTRIGPPGTVWIDNITVTNRAFTYESTIAHEYQHLIHHDYNPADPSFMNEGCSMYAEYLCGYGIDPSYLNSYFYTPDNSLTVWGDQGGINILADYGAAALWAIYLSDHYGGAAFLSYFVDAGVPGIDGVTDALSHFGYKVTFNDVYRDWRIANLIRSDFPGKGIYNYKSINLNDPSIISVKTYNTIGAVPLTKGSAFGNTITILGYDTGISLIGTYGSDYIKFQNWRRPGIIDFKGDKSTVYGWTYDTTNGYWWSGNDDLYNALLTAKAHVDPSNPSLTLVTRWGAESFWDFCFVQVSTDQGKTWTSLANEYTTSDHDPSAYPGIIAYLPGLTDYNPEWPDWTTMTFDLSSYAGQDVMIGFRYMTDWATTYEGWFIQSASIGGTTLQLTPVYPSVAFQVSLVYAWVTCRGTVYIPWDMWLNHRTEAGYALVFADQPNYLVMIVSPIMSGGFADYQFSATPICHGCCW
jgi:immune inhibitor A